MFSRLTADFYQKAAVYGLPPTRASLLRMLVNDGSLAQLLFRAMSYCQCNHMKAFAAIIYRLNGLITNATIGRDADIGPGFVIVHSVGIVINASVRAGRNLVVYQGVTIGAERFRSPILGDNVLVGAGAKIIGGIRVGSNVKVGANAVVTKDVPDGATVIGIPARIVRMYGAPVGPPK